MQGIQVQAVAGCREDAAAVPLPLSLRCLAAAPRHFYQHGLGAQQSVAQSPLYRSQAKAAFYDIASCAPKRQLSTMRVWGSLVARCQWLVNCVLPYRQPNLSG